MKLTLVLKQWIENKRYVSKLRDRLLKNCVFNPNFSPILAIF
ncbi:hypothetical protein COO91_06121 [Nostoc flagelliforme CCNUN1]|uniref:Uncharacterized protein n=1 Tax=Nostoc flagelliforme CCNUN1 TaxID=2038116 RepID=A0A2K8SXE0_9NOSO|nr:hypothetical protein COO91_06121 [Nostoc flagelliforme CCNUN1]